jgi:hypothetical protein
VVVTAREAWRVLGAQDRSYAGYKLKTRSAAKKRYSLKKVTSRQKYLQNMAAAASPGVESGRARFFPKHGRQGATHTKIIRGAHSKVFQKLLPYSV